MRGSFECLVFGGLSNHFVLVEKILFAHGGIWTRTGSRVLLDPQYVYIASSERCLGVSIEVRKPAI